MDYPNLILKPGREKSLQQRHPWVFSGAVERIIGQAEPGQTVRIQDAKRKFLGWGAYNPKSQIAARVWSWREDEEVNAEFIYKRIQAAYNLRNESDLSDVTNSCRCVFSESDGFPGLVVDRYNEQLVLQISSSGAEFWRSEIYADLQEITGTRNLFEKSDSEIRKLDGLPARVELIGGTLPDAALEIQEWGIKYLVDIQHGQKTGFYLDQRQNRNKIRQFALGKRVLNCFSYTGGFSLNAAAGGAKEIISIDSSASANQLAQKNLELNSMQIASCKWVTADVFTELRVLRDRGEKFDLIILDPPKFAPTYHSIERANRAYKDVNLLGMKLLNRGGILFTFSCSGGVSADLFRKIVHGAAVDAGVNAVILEQLHQDMDHPIPIHFPEAEYLKGLICKIEPE